MTMMVLLIATTTAFVSPSPNRLSRLKLAGEDDPLEIDGDVRDFRARLISRSKTEDGLISAAPLEEETKSWAYETSLLEKGSVLLGSSVFGLRQQYFHKCVVVLLQHDDSFTKGVMVNRPTRKLLDGWPVWMGGDVSEGGIFTSGTVLDIECLTALNLEGCKEVVRGVQRTSFENAKKLVRENKATKEDFWVFCGYSGWRPGQLAAEHARGSWFVAAADGESLLSELLKARDADGDVLDDGIGTWESLMRRIGREPTKDVFDDKMLRVYVDAILAPPINKAAAFRLAPKKNEKYEELLDENGFVARGSLLAGRVVDKSTDFLLDRQFLHKSLVLVLLSKDDDVVVLALNRPTQFNAAVEISPNVKRMRPVAFGGDIHASSDLLCWIKLARPRPGDDVLLGPPSQRMGDPLKKVPCLCDQERMSESLIRGQAPVSDVLPICGLTAFKLDEFRTLIQNGSLTPLDRRLFPWRQLFNLHQDKNDDGSEVWELALRANGLEVPESSPLADQALQKFAQMYYQKNDF